MTVFLLLVTDEEYQGSQGLDETGKQYPFTYHAKKQVHLRKNFFQGSVRKPAGNLVPARCQTRRLWTESAQRNVRKNSGAHAKTCYNVI